MRRRWRRATPQRRQTYRLSVSSAVLGLVVAFTVVAVAGPWQSGQRAAERARAGTLADSSDVGGATERVLPDLGRPGPAPSAPDVLPALRGQGGSRTASGGDNAPPPPDASALAETLKPLLDDPALGSVVAASVTDAVTGRQLFSHHADRPITPASTNKLATAVAVLSARGADHRIPTRVVRGDGGRVVLIGGGDPTLSSRDLAALAEDTARALGSGEGDGPAADGPAKVELGYDVSLYTGPELHSIGPNNNLARVTPLMVDQARLDDSRHGPAPRAPEPAAAAAREFAKRLAEHGVKVAGEPEETTAADDAKQLAVHRSAPLSAIVERMLTHSDNDIAEAMARQTALATGKPASFEGGGQAVRARLQKLGLPVKGTHFADGSGLSRDDKVTARLLTELLTLAADPEHPRLRTVLTGLPVAHFTGTLGGRYDGDGRAAGRVRAKTGTLTGVNTLAGTVVDAEGRMLAFAFLTTGTDDRYRAQDALDRMASALARCGCR